MSRWLEFEKSVAEFVSALDPTAKVTHDAKLPDIHTGRLRQRDVWIEARLGGHLPVNVLVSCKDKRSKLSQQDIDAFAGELRSSAAQMGVLYSRSGFSGPALAKAGKLGIACCILYENQPSDLPHLQVMSAYLCNETVRLTCSRPLEEGLRVVEDLFDIPHWESGKTVLEALIEAYETSKQAATEVWASSLEPGEWRARVEFSAPGFPSDAYLLAQSGWKKFAAKAQTHLFNGSYCFTNGDFKGSISGPIIDTQSSHPGSGWEEFEGPITLAPVGVRTVILRMGGDWAAVLREEHAGRTFGEAFPNALPTAQAG